MDKTTSSNEQKAYAKSTGFRLDYRILIGLLLVVIACMLAVWRPWNETSDSADARTIVVSGESTIKATPDEFIFSPTYEFKNSDRAAALKAMTAKSNELVAKLKSQGVPDSKIKTNSDSWSIPYYIAEDNTTPTYTLRLTVTATSQELAQKVQDYLVTTDPSGAISPSANFSTGKRKSLQNEARNQATTDARTKADQSAKNLGFKIKSVKSVSDGTDFGNIFATDSAAKAMESSSDIAPSTEPELAIQAGENELTYNISVTYYIK